MIKVFSLLRRPEGWSRERFHRWWLEEHVPLVTGLTGLRKYRVCLVQGSTTHEGREPWDGLAELWFDSGAALEAAWSSDAGLAAVGHSKATVSDRLVLITEEHAILG